MLPTDYDERKALPVFTFLTKYFPLAFLEVVRVAVAGDKQHGNTGAEIHWAREKSTDQLNTALRHIMDYGMGQAIDTDGRAHLAKAIWRLSAQLQLDEEARLNDKPVGMMAYATPGLTPAESAAWALIKDCPLCDAKVERGIDYVRIQHAPGCAGPPEVTAPRPPRICSDCGADLDETGHAYSCLTQEHFRSLKF